VTNTDFALPLNLISKEPLIMKQLSKLAITALVAIFSTSISAQINVPGYVIKDGLVGWWPFSGNAADSSGF
jgi:hypothetical protein